MVITFGLFTFLSQKWTCDRKTDVFCLPVELCDPLVLQETNYFSPSCFHYNPS